MAKSIKIRNYKQEEKRIEFQTRKVKEASNSAPFSQIERESQNFIYLLNWFCAFYDPIWRIIDFIILFLATGASIKKTFTQPTQRTFLSFIQMTSDVTGKSERSKEMKPVKFHNSMHSKKNPIL